MGNILFISCPVMCKYVNVEKGLGKKCIQQIDNNACLGDRAQRVFAVESNPICTVVTACTVTRKIYLCVPCFIKTDYSNIVYKT